MNLWFSVYTVHETLVLSLYVSDNGVEYCDNLDPNLVHYTAYWRITLEKLFPLPLCLKMKTSLVFNSLHFLSFTLFHALTFHLMQMCNFLGFIIMQVIMKIYIFFLSYILTNLRLLSMYTDTCINDREANELLVKWEIPGKYFLVSAWILFTIQFHALLAVKAVNQVKRTSQPIKKKFLWIPFLYRKE